MSLNQNFIISIKGNKDQLDCKNKYQLDEDSIIELKGEFRSAGKIKSLIYFGLKCFRENGQGIKREDINRINEPLLITSINTDNKSLSFIKSQKNGIIIMIPIVKLILSILDFISMEILIIYLIIYLSIIIMIII